jgi:thymidylate synthase
MGEFVTDKSGVKTIELVGAAFVADEPSIFGEVNWDYVDREIAWYESQSLLVADIPGGPPKVWEQVASRNGEINSNYGWCIFSLRNGGQYSNVLNELQKNPNSRRALMIYTRPTMWSEFERDGMSDFMCTNAVQYLVRDGYLNAVVQMRSNDVTYGYKNDRAWQLYVLEKLATDLSLNVGNIFWNAGSLHIYERDFYLVDHWSKTGESTVKKSRYRELYPDSEWAK